MSDLSEGMTKFMQIIGLNEENASKAVALIEAHVEERVKEGIGDLSSAIDEYMNQEVGAAIGQLQESTAELAQLMNDMTTAKDAAERRSILLRISALSKELAVSAAKDSDWGGEAPDASAANRASITPHREDYVLKQQALSVFNEFTQGMSNINREAMKMLSEDVEFNGDVDDLWEQLENVRNESLPHSVPVAAYCQAISRHVRR